MKTKLTNLANYLWYQPNPFYYLLLPLSLIFRIIAALRRWGFKLGLLKSIRLPVPVIIVGNLSVGGTGKTPLVIYLVELLKQQGLHPGVVSRGYGGTAITTPQLVTAKSSPKQCGDEPVLIAARCECPVVVGVNRVSAARRLITEFHCDVIVSDDGLQHYRLARDIEIAVVDGERQFGNRHCLPAGPLREPVSRLKHVDFVVANGKMVVGHEFVMTLNAHSLQSLSQQNPLALSAFDGKTVHAVAGIADPQRFFRTLHQYNIHVIPHRFPDHHEFQASDFDFADGRPVIMTEKDAVKCHGFNLTNAWYLPISGELTKLFTEQFLQLAHTKLLVDHTP